MNNTDEYFRDSAGGGIDDNNFTNPGSGVGFDSGSDFVPPPITERARDLNTYEPSEDNEDDESDFEQPDFGISAEDQAVFDRLAEEQAARQEQARRTAELDATLLDQSDLVFDSEYYLEQNPDIAAANIDPEAHFNRFGKSEGREYRFLLNDEYIPEGNRTAAVDGGYFSILDKYIFFDVFYYLTENPDVAAAEINAVTHFSNYGESEGREYRYVYYLDFLEEGSSYFGTDSEDPLLSSSGNLTGGEQDFGSSAVTESEFDHNFYLEQNPDIAAAGVDPYDHYISYGQAEGRIPYADFELASISTNDSTETLLVNSSNESFI